MAIVQLPLPIAANTGVVPNLKTMTVTDNLATLTSAGFLNAGNLQGYNVEPNDILLVKYDYDAVAGTNKDIRLNVTLNNGVITLVPDVSEGNVDLPVVVDNFAVFADLLGKIKDKGYVASDPNLNNVVMQNGVPAVNNFAAYSDVNGTIKNGYGPSDNTKTTVPMLNAAPTVSGNFANFTDAAGTIGDSNFLPSDAAKTNVVMADSATVVTHFANFSDVNGTVKDDGYLPSDALKTNVVMADGATSVDNFASFSDVNGTIASKYVPSDALKTNVVMADAATAVQSLAEFSDVNGTVRDAGYLLNGGTTVVFGAGPNTFVVVDAAITPSSKITISPVDPGGAPWVSGEEVIDVSASVGQFVITTRIGTTSARQWNYVAFIPNP